ncbi:transporter substrate-binding domain-containing protein [Angustibacter aerolatus]
MPQQHPRTRRRARASGLFAAGLVIAGVLAACGDASGDVDAEPAANASDATQSVVTVGALSNGSAQETKLTVTRDDSIRAELPAAVRDKGELVIGLGLLPSGAPPLGFVGTDQKTLTGSEPDLGRLVAGVLGLKPVVDNATWDNLFVGIDSGRTDLGFSNITDTEQRKEKYDFACYRQDNLGFEVLKSSSFAFTGDPEVLAGRTVAVGAGTNQEKILLGWRTKLQQEGKTLTVKYFADQNATYLALASGKIDAYFAPNPSIVYHATQTASTPNPTKAAGTFSGAGQSLQGLICATSKKDSGLAKPVADAINSLIDGGQYQQWLTAWHLEAEAVKSSEVNPPGLPVTSS